MPDYNLLGSTEVLEELQSGRTRELLLLLQDKPVPEVVDPLNIQTGLSSGYVTDGNGDYILKSGTLIDDFESGDSVVENSDYGNWSVDKGAGTTSFNVQSNVALFGSFSGELFANDGSLDVVSDRSSAATPSSFEFYCQIDNQTGASDRKQGFRLVNSAGDNVGVDFGGDGMIYDGNGNSLGASWSVNTLYRVILFNIDYSNYTFDVKIINADSSTEIVNTSVDPVDEIDNVDKIRFELNTATTGQATSFYVDEVDEVATFLNGEVTDKFAAPTAEPADFKQWNSIQARDVTTSGSTSANPVEFEILDSTDTALNSTRIPKAQIADEPFTMRNRVYSEDAGSDGQSDYQIATTGDGGHFGIPILTVVSVKKNGSVLDSANWSFDPDTKTVTIDTSNVSIASGDTIDIKYDFDVFDSTLQPRAYLSRESSSETSPSISHFRYEYVI